jgi:KipI family sensor histidine kinase inhibitor
MDNMKILPAGDRALVADFGNVISEDVNRKVNVLKKSLLAAKVAGVREMIPTYRSLLVEYNPSVISMQDLSRRIEAASLEGAGVEAEKKRVLEIPCCYGGQYGEDLAGLAELTGLSEKEIIDIHAGTEYRVYMLGFLPGFVYLGGMDERIAAPRLKSPRVSIPAGSVGIGGSQTGVYPMASPGGWRLIGMTPVDFYDPKREKPVLCEAGDYIRFVPISPEEYERQKKEGGAV